MPHVPIELQGLNAKVDRIHPNLPTGDLRHLIQRNRKKTGKAAVPTGNQVNIFLLTPLQIDLPMADKWLSDGGAVNHTCGDRKWFTDYYEFDQPIELVGFDRYVQIIGIGTCVVESYMHGK